MAKAIGFRFSLLRMTPARKPRTECCCQPVACIIAATVAPAGDRNMAITRACLEDVSLSLTEWTMAGCEGFVVVARASLVLGERLFTDFLAGFGIGISLRYYG